MVTTIIGYARQRVKSRVEKITFKESIDSCQLGFNKLKPAGNWQLDSFKADAVIEQYHFLINPKFKKWYYKQLYRVGVSKFIELAGRAAEGKQPSRLFSKLLKDA